MGNVEQPLVDKEASTEANPRTVEQAQGDKETTGQVNPTVTIDGILEGEAGDKETATQADPNSTIDVKSEGEALRDKVAITLTQADGEDRLDAVLESIASAREKAPKEEHDFTMDEPEV